MTTRTARAHLSGSWSILSFSNHSLHSWWSPARRGTLLLALALAPLCALAQLADATAHRVRIKDVATIEGVRDNQLIGYGIVVGLNGTGDSQQTVFPVQTLISTLQRMGVNVPTTGNASTLRVQNMAAAWPR